jgi:hypothetical protein
MAKSNRGGKAGATLTRGQVYPGTRFPNSTNLFMGQQAAQPTPQPIPQPTPQPIPQPNPIQQNTAGVDAFRKLTNDQRTDAIANALKTQVPTFLADNALQRAMYGLKLNDKPTLVDDNVLDTMPGTDLFRNVNYFHDKANDLYYSATDIANQVMRGTVTRVSDQGGSVHGRGIYFGNTYSSSGVYGDTRNDISKTAVMRAKLSPTAKIIHESSVDSAVAREMRSGTKLGKMLSSVSHYDRTALYAMVHGYDAIVDRHTGYHVVINRGALVMSKTVKAKTGSW